MDVMMIASLLILCLVIFLGYSRLRRNQEKDSALRQKAVLSTTEQLMFSRLREVLPQTQVLAHVSFDALLTTKYLHTRRKYQKMVADFVLLDQDYRVIAVIAVADFNLMKRSKNAAFQDAMLEAAGYRVLRYVGVPDAAQLRVDFLYNLNTTLDGEHVAGQLLNNAQSYAERIAQSRAFG